MKFNHLLAPLLGVLLLPCAYGANVLVNNNFEAFSILSSGYNTAYNVTTNPNGYQQSFGTSPTVSRQYLETTTGMGWLTTAADNRIEIWQSGHTGVPSPQGAQFAEINATTSATLYQDITIDAAGLVDYSFRHRGRAGTDTLQVTITYLGEDGMFGGGDDVQMDQKSFSTGNTAWVLYNEQDKFTSVANGNYRFAYTALASASSDLSLGNFIDDVNFGVALPVPEPSITLLGGLGLLGLFARRRRA